MGDPPVRPPLPSTWATNTGLAEVRLTLPVVLLVFCTVYLRVCLPVGQVACQLVCLSACLSDAVVVLSVL